MKRKRILITGAAGFIGYHLALALKSRGDGVIGLDNFNSYYTPKLKQTRADCLKERGIEIVRADIQQIELLKQLLVKEEITHLVHLAAQAGVRHSIHHPEDYVASNLDGFACVLESCRFRPKTKLVFASSSSVYGLNKKIPFSVDDKTDSPANFYGATKKANEIMAYSYHHLYGICATALRYFTAYGPWGRPDMAYYRFSQQICDGESIQIFNKGEMKRDFTYIDDIVAGTIAAIDLEAEWEIFNLGNNRPVRLMDLISLLEQELGKTAIKEFLPMQPGEVIETYADIEKSKRLLGFSPRTPIEEGISRFAQWFREYRESQMANSQSHRLQCSL